MVDIMEASISQWGAMLTERTDGDEQERATNSGHKPPALGAYFTIKSKVVLHFFCASTFALFFQPEYLSFAMTM